MLSKHARFSHAEVGAVPATLSRGGARAAALQPPPGDTQGRSGLKPSYYGKEIK